MRILLDHWVTNRLKRLLSGHEVKHTKDLGWEKIDNGVLIATGAEAGFDVMMTVDKNIRHQNVLERLPMPVLELNTVLTTVDALRTIAPSFDAALAATRDFRFVSIAADGTIETLAPRSS